MWLWKLHILSSRDGIIYRAPPRRIWAFGRQAGLNKARRGYMKSIWPAPVWEGAKMYLSKKKKYLSKKKNVFATNLPELNIESFHETPHGKLGSWIWNPGEKNVFSLKVETFVLGVLNYPRLFLITCKAPQHVMEVRTWRWCSLCEGKREYLPNFSHFRVFFMNFSRAYKEENKSIIITTFTIISMYNHHPNDEGFMLVYICSGIWSIAGSATLQN